MGGGDQGRNARLSDAVARFAATLPPDQAQLLRLIFVEGASHEEAAAALGANVRRCKYLKKKILARAAVDPNLSRALDELTVESPP